MWEILEFSGGPDYGWYVLIGTDFDDEHRPALARGYTVFPDDPALLGVDLSDDTAVQAVVFDLAVEHANDARP